MFVSLLSRANSTLFLSSFDCASSTIFWHFFWYSLYKSSNSLSSFCFSLISNYFSRLTNSILNLSSNFSRSSLSILSLIWMNIGCFNTSSSMCYRTYCSWNSWIFLFFNFCSCSLVQCFSCVISLSSSDILELTAISCSFLMMAKTYWN